MNTTYKMQPYGMKPDEKFIQDFARDENDLRPENQRKLTKLMHRRERRIMRIDLKCKGCRFGH